MANNVRSINLLPGSKEDNFLTQFLNWALTIGRLLIILTETLALGTFLYRFNLDMKIVDLHDQIKDQSTIVKLYEGQEKEFRNLQMRLALAKAYDENNTTPEIFRDIAEMGRGKVTFKNLLVATEEVKIEAEASSNATLAQFVDTFKNYPKVTDVSIDKVENKTTSAKISVVLSARLKPNPNTLTPETTDDTNAQPAAPAAPETEAPAPGGEGVAQ